MFILFYFVFLFRGGWFSWENLGILDMSSMTMGEGGSFLC